MISIVDDDRSVREAVRSLSFDPLGYDAATFASAEGISVPETFGNSECVITDLQMPGMTEIDLQDKLIADGYCEAIHFHERAIRGRGRCSRNGH